MTQEEKVKAYDEAIKRAKKELNTCGSQDCDAAKQIFRFFPELKESEDERIRRRFICFLTNLLEQGGMLADGWDCKECEEYIAWLEKPGEQNKWKPSKDEMNALYGLAYITNKMDDRKDVAITKLYQDLKREFFNGASYENMFLSSPVDSDVNIEKQGENKPTPKFEIGDIIHRIRENTVFPMTIEKIEDGFYVCNNSHSFVNIKFQDDYELVEQKTTDKVEPKFKVGDWITNGTCIIKITSIDDRYYWHDNDCVGGDIRSIDKEYRLWAIQDAKDGDVLAESKMGAILMFRGIGNTNWDDVVDYHCYYDCYLKDFIVQEGVEHWGNIENNQLVPATKKQRDTLFAKMKEAGYMWDAEKKELKKIEANTAWSEEDEKNALDIKCLILNYRIGNGEYELCSWIDNLKDRLQPQPKQEWSEEDEHYKNGLIGLVENSKAGLPINLRGKAADKCIDWLKSLKPQKHWKPTKEQMKALKYVVDYFGELTEHFAEYDEIKPLYDNLKNL